VSVINGATNSVTHTISEGSAFGVAVDAATHTLYVTNLCDECSGTGGTVSVVNTTTNAVTASITVESELRGVAVDESTDTIYVANECGNQAPDCPINPYPGTVSVINGATNTVTNTVNLTAPLAQDSFGVAIDQTTDTIYTAVTFSDAVKVIFPASVSVSPASGGPGTSVTVSGRGFNPGESVKIAYKTGLASQGSVTICSATQARTLRSAAQARPPQQPRPAPTSLIKSWPKERPRTSKSRPPSH